MELVLKMDKAYLRKHKIHYTGDLEETRGLFDMECNDIFINLSANQFLNTLKLSEEYFIKELANTILHECLHQLIFENVYSQEDDFYYTKDGEEQVVLLVANQITSIPQMFPNWSTVNHL